MRCRYRDLYEYCADPADYTVHYALNWSSLDLCQRHHDSMNVAEDKYVTSVDQLGVQT